MKRAWAVTTMITAGLLAVHCRAGKTATEQEARTSAGQQSDLHSYCVSVFQPDGAEDRWRLQTTEVLTPIPGPETKKSIELALQTLADERRDPVLKVAAGTVAWHLEPAWGTGRPNVRRKPGDWGPSGEPSRYDCFGAKTLFDQNKNFMGCIRGTFDGCYICIAG